MSNGRNTARRTALHPITGPKDRVQETGPGGDRPGAYTDVRFVTFSADTPAAQEVWPGMVMSLPAAISDAPGFVGLLRFHRRVTLSSRPKY